MKHIITIAAMFALFGNLAAQANLQRVTFSSGAVDNNQLTATVGEVFATRVSGSGGSLNMGAQPGIDNSGVGIQEIIQLEGIKIYPNPTNGSVWIQVENAALQNALYEVFDAQGRLVQSANLAVGLNHLDIQTQAAGIYIVKVYGNNQAQSFQLLKN